MIFHPDFNAWETGNKSKCPIFPLDNQEEFNFPTLAVLAIKFSGSSSATLLPMIKSSSVCKIWIISLAIFHIQTAKFLECVGYIFCNLLNAYHPGIHSGPGTNGNKVIINQLINKIRRLLQTLIWNINTVLSKGFHESSLRWFPVTTPTEKEVILLTCTFVPVNVWKSSQCLQPYLFWHGIPHETCNPQTHVVLFMISNTIKEIKYGKDLVKTFYLPLP